MPLKNCGQGLRLESFYISIFWSDARQAALAARNTFYNRQERSFMHKHLIYNCEQYFRDQLYTTVHYLPI